MNSGSQLDSNFNEGEVGSEWRKDDVPDSDLLDAETDGSDKEKETDDDKDGKEKEFLDDGNKDEMEVTEEQPKKSGRRGDGRNKINIKMRSNG